MSNEYGIQAAAAVSPQNTTMTAALASREAQRVMGQIMIARNCPRDLAWARSRILAECKRPELAEKAEYTYERGGSKITGPSIHLALTIARNYGNLEADLVELEQGEGYSKVEAYCWDMETNFRRSITFDVKHERSTRSGSYKLTDSRDIYELMANYGNRRLRACILNTIPGDIVDEAVQACRDTLRAELEKEQDQKKLLARARKLVDAFSAYGVTTDMLVANREGRAMEQWTVEDMTELMSIGTSLKDGVTKASDHFAGAASTQVISKAQVEELMRLIGKDTQAGLKALNDAGYKQANKIVEADFERVKEAITKAVQP